MNLEDWPRRDLEKYACELGYTLEFIADCDDEELIDAIIDAEDENDLVF